MGKTYIGIDLGKTRGAIVIIKDGKIIERQPTPLMGGDKQVIDAREIFKFMYKYRNQDCHAVMEKLHGLPNQKLSVIWELSQHVGMIKMLLAILKIAYTEVTPQSWQKEMFLGVTIQEKKVKGLWKKDTKATSVLAAQKLFPKEDLRATAKSKVPHDGITDALLLAEYGRRKGI
jgi:hypothetical protein